MSNPENPEPPAESPITPAPIPGEAEPVTMATEPLPGDTPVDEAETAEPEVEHLVTPEVEAFANVFARSVGAAAMVGTRAWEGASDSFHKYSRKAAEFTVGLQNRAANGLGDYFENRYRERAAFYAPALNDLVEEVKLSKLHERVSLVSDNIDQIGQILDGVKVTVPHRVAAKLGLAPSINSTQSEEREQYTSQVETVGAFPLGAKETKAAGNWTEYQKALLDLAEKTEAQAKAGASPADTESYVAGVDKILSRVRPGSSELSTVSLIEHKNEVNAKKHADKEAAIEAKKAKVAYSFELARTFDMERIIQIKEDVQKEFNRSVRSAQLTGDIAYGYDPAVAKAEIIQKYIYKYLNLPTDGSKPATGVRAEAQDLLKGLLSSPMSRLERIVKQQKEKAAVAAAGGGTGDTPENPADTVPEVITPPDTHAGPTLEVPTRRSDRIANYYERRFITNMHKSRYNKNRADRIERKAKLWTAGSKTGRRMTNDVAKLRQKSINHEKTAKRQKTSHDRRKQKTSKVDVSGLV